mmetsp:Transcript_29610/g.96445  ORF Transcript_29610/g.96445 Transcript_29610/m.96445 type:complete len:255 (+) Transcript_29610:66-830(+)
MWARQKQHVERSVEHALHDTTWPQGTNATSRGAERQTAHSPLSPACVSSSAAAAVEAAAAALALLSRVTSAADSAAAPALPPVLGAPPSAADMIAPSVACPPGLARAVATSAVTRSLSPAASAELMSSISSGSAAAMARACSGVAPGTSTATAAAGVRRSRGGGARADPAAPASAAAAADDDDGCGLGIVCARGCIPEGIDCGATRTCGGALHEPTSDSRKPAGASPSTGLSSSWRQAVPLLLSLTNKSAQELP